MFLPTTCQPSGKDSSLVCCEVVQRRLFWFSNHAINSETSGARERGFSVQKTADDVCFFSFSA